MANETSQAFKKLENFFKTSIKYYGKRISLNSNQHFSIDQLCDLDNNQEENINYVIQYGFPQSGGICMHFTYEKKRNSFTITKVSVYAPAAGKNMVVANFASQSNVGPMNVNINFGLNADTKEHTKLSEIEANPNAMEMIDIAISDLNDAQILGECMLAVPKGSKFIPCCECLNISKTKGKSM